MPGPMTEVFAMSGLGDDAPGDRIEKVDEDTYRLTNGVFTSCDLDRPAWSFHIGDADVTLDDYARMRNVSFRARNLPIFYTPRLIWPTKRDRSQGFLIPRAKFTDEFGTRLETGYFIPFGDSWDATLYADVSWSESITRSSSSKFRPQLAGYVIVSRTLFAPSITNTERTVIVSLAFGWIMS